MKTIITLIILLLWVPVFSQQERIIGKANLSKEDITRWTDQRDWQMTGIILEAARTGALQLYDSAGTNSLQPISYGHFLKAMENTYEYAEWEAAPDFGTYQPWSIARFNDTLYRAVAWSDGERPDTSRAWILTRPESHYPVDLQWYFEFNKNGKKLQPVRIHFRNPDNRFVACIFFADAVSVLNESGVVWYQPDAVRQVARGFYLNSFSECIWTRQLDSLRKKGRIQFKGNLVKTYDCDLRLKYKDNQLEKLVIVEMPSVGAAGEGIASDTLDGKLLQAQYPFKALEFYLLGDALQMPGAIEFPNAQELISPPSKKTRTAWRKKINSLTTRIVEEVSVRSPVNFSFRSDTATISRFSLELFNALKKPGMNIPLYSNDSLTRLKKQEQFMLDIIEIDDTYSSWYPNVIYTTKDQVGYLGNVYGCIRNHFSRTPGESPQFWKLLYPISNHQVPPTMVLLFDVVISTNGNVISKELKSLGWFDSNYPDFRDTYLALVKVEDVKKYLISHPEQKVNWEKAMEILGHSDNKYIRMITCRNLTIGK